MLRFVMVVMISALIVVVQAEPLLKHHDLESQLLEDQFAFMKEGSYLGDGLNRQQSLGLDLSMGLGFHCGRFDPVASVSHTLNQFQKGIHNVVNQVAEHATSAIVGLPMYKLAQANPKLYNILNQNLISAEQQFSIAMKTCNQMEQEALNGENPYLGWMRVSRQQTMATLQNKNGERNLHQAFQTLESENGREGLPWLAQDHHVRGEPAGGEGQRPIWVIHDISEAGYRELYQEEASILFSSRSEAANWITGVVGDYMVTTCAGCSRASLTPRGLYYNIDQAKEKINQYLTERVQHSHKGGFTDTVNKELQWSITSHLIESLRHFDWHHQNRIIDLLSENLATIDAIKKALLAKRILRAGAQLPEAVVIAEVQKQVSGAIIFLDQEVADAMRSFEIKNKLFKSDIQNLLELDGTLTQQSILPESLEHKPLHSINTALLLETGV